MARKKKPITTRKGKRKTSKKRSHGQPSSKSKKNRKKKPSPRKPSRKPSRKKALKRLPKAASKRPKKGPTSKRLSGPQRSARESLLSYLARLGKRKAARRLDATVAEIETWLKRRQIPRDILPEVTGLATLGGSHTYIRGTSFKKAWEILGPKKLSELTGIPTSRIRQILHRRPKARIKTSRARLAQAAKKIGWESLAEIYDTTEPNLKRASKYPQTETTRRFSELVSEYGDDMVAWYIGVDPRLVRKWLEGNVPRTWEPDLNRIIGRRADQGVDREHIRARWQDKRQIEPLIDKAVEEAKKWNKKVPPKFQIPKSQAERWARLREFDMQIARVKIGYEQYLKETKKRPGRPAQKPIPAPPFEPRPLFPKPLPPLPKPTKPTAPPIERAIAIAMREFMGKRAEAIADGKNSGYAPLDEWEKYTPWQGTIRHGFRYYSRVHKFVVLADLTKLGNEIIENARQMWKLIEKPGEFMTIRFTLSAQGTGNPFYPGAFEPDKNEFTFCNRNTDIIIEIHQIDRQVRSILEHIWEVAQEYLLFFEHYEIVKSIPFERQA